jgi:hypothetical protein
MKKQILILFISMGAFSQQIDNKMKTHIINPKNNWYFGVELGRNEIKSNDFIDNSTINIGVSAEYYFHKYWSIQSKIQFYKTEVAYSTQSTFLSNGTKPYQTLFFDGTIVSIPITAKWEFKINKNFRGFLNFGTAYNIETESNYVIPNVANPNLAYFPTNYFSLNLGWGLNYNISKKAALYLSYTINSGGYKGHTDDFMSSYDRVATNLLINIGMKYNFKKQK